jgi:anti-sigma factor RsiW
MMEHERFLRELDALDSGSLLSAEAREHVARCPRCAAELDRAELVKAMLVSLSPEPPEEFVTRVTQAIRRTARPSGMLSFRDWVIVLALVSGAVALAPFGDGFAWARGFFGTAYVLPMMLTLGGALAVFGLILVGTHMDDVHGILHAARKR